ncbi:MAG: hypothetical protein COY66_02875 [Candidatus Kerfeldbacteria bacterium CG_4_10_14_0_8_um_filter_42_10]|uniref:Uncharacterized protein n=1 Tax=Candidatus Kerfeldbacteria bacterium CG_4_10_14_0_8_um_filter_42_10 TaxID=2014248 RepID=A0A2M7RJK4_9BACT|nr:MAG: hypothetical protein COY66_02875 [Candidatus Kerfeldbacteria bacterium CG_4_10_14_0_8_um_filter_42_10]
MKKGTAIPAQTVDIEVSVVLFPTTYDLEKLPPGFKCEKDVTGVRLGYSIGPFEFPELTEDDSQPGDGVRHHLKPGVWDEKLKPVWLNAYADAKRKASELAPAFQGWSISSISLSVQGNLSAIVAASTFDSQHMGEKFPIINF